MNCDKSEDSDKPSNRCPSRSQTGGECASRAGHYGNVHCDPKRQEEWVEEMNCTCLPDIARPDYAIGCPAHDPAQRTSDPLGRNPCDGHGPNWVCSHCSAASQRPKEALPPGLSYPPQYSLDDYKNAPSGIGPLADQWKDKPHRLIYDLVARLRTKDMLEDEFITRCADTWLARKHQGREQLVMLMKQIHDDGKAREFASRQGTSETETRSINQRCMECGVPPRVSCFNLVGSDRVQCSPHEVLPDATANNNLRAEIRNLPRFKVEQLLLEAIKRNETYRKD